MLEIMLLVATCPGTMAAAALAGPGEAYLIVGTPARPVVIHGKVSLGTFMNRPVVNMTVPSDDGGTAWYTLDDYHAGKVFPSRAAAYWRAAQIARRHADEAAKVADELDNEVKRSRP